MEGTLGREKGSVGRSFCPPVPLHALGEGSGH